MPPGGPALMPIAIFGEKMAMDRLAATNDPLAEHGFAVPP